MAQMDSGKTTTDDNGNNFDWLKKKKRVVDIKSDQGTKWAQVVSILNILRADAWSLPLAALH